MANIYDVASAIQQPNIVGNFNQGVQIGQQNQVFGQKQAAYQQALGDQQNIRALAPQVIAGDPNAYSQVAAIDPNEATQLQGAGDNQVRRFAGAINMLNQATKTNNPAAIDAAWQQARPYLSQIAGKPAPDHWDPSFQPGLDQAMAHIAQLPQQKSDLINVGAGGAIFDPKTRQAIYSNPGVQKTPPIVSVNLPDGSTQQYQQNPDGSLAPLRLGPQGTQAAPQGQFQTSITPASPVNSGAAAQANALLAQGMQPQEVMQRLVQSNPDQQFQLAVDPATGQFKDVSNGSAQIPAPATDVGGLGHSAPKGSSEKAPSGYRFNADKTALIPIPGGPADKGQAAAPIGDVTLTGQAYLQSLGDPSLQQQIQAIAEGRMPLPKVSRPSKQGEISPQTLQQAVAQYDPTYDQADPSSRIKARNDFTSGKSAVQLRQLNTLLGHLGGLADATDKLDNTGNTLVNAGMNAVGSTYNTKVSNFDAAARPAAEEFAALLKGGVPSVEEIKQAHDMLNANKTPDQLHGVIGTMAAQIQSRIAALNAQAKNSLGPFANKVTIITPEGQAALDHLRERGLIGKFDLGEEGAAQPTPSMQSQTQPSAQPRAVNSMGHAVIWNGSAWVPE